MRRPIALQVIMSSVLLAHAALVFTAGPASAELRITYPTDGTTVPVGIIEIEGVGADPTGTIEVKVLTNRWYLQDGVPEISPDGTWTYGPCHLEGSGRYNNHTIKVTIIKNGKRGESTSVRRVVRQE